MMEHEIKRLWGTCQMSLMDSKEDCDDALFGICSDLAIKQVEGVNRKKRLNKCAKATRPCKDCNFKINIIPQNRKSHYVNTIIYTFKRKQL